jgi:hypothetical protein
MAKEGADKSPTKRQIENQKYIKIKLKPHKIGCIKLFLIHSKNPAIEKIEIKDKKIQ